MSAGASPRSGGTLKRALAVLLTIGGVAVLASLGAWQIARGSEKRAAISSLLEQAQAEPRPLPPRAEWPALAQAGDLTRVRLVGRYLDGQTRAVRATLPEPRPNDRRLGGYGVWLFTPFVLNEGGVVFVNRGFSPADIQGRTPPLPAPAGKQVVTGFLRTPERPSAFTPSDRPERGEFHVRDPERLRVGLDSADLAPFHVDAERTGDALIAPVGLDATELAARVPDNHRQYAFTWFALAASLAVMGLVWWRRDGSSAHPPISA